jgi:hypothetical protein
VDWPDAQGKVISSKIVWGHVEILYEYWPFAERHEGVHKISLKPVAAGGRGWEALKSARNFTDEADGYMADFPVGAKVIIRYNPSKPQDSVLYCAGEVCSHDSSETNVEPPHFITLE